MEPRPLRLNLTFLLAFFLIAFFLSASCHSLPPSTSPQHPSKPRPPSASTKGESPQPRSPGRTGIPPHYPISPHSPFHAPPMGRPKVVSQPNDLNRDPPGKSIPKDLKHCRPGARNCIRGNMSLPKKKKFNMGKKLGLVFAGVGVALQGLLGGFLIYKRWQLREVEDARDRIPPRSTFPSTA